MIWGWTTTPLGEISEYRNLGKLGASERAFQTCVSADHFPLQKFRTRRVAPIFNYLQLASVIGHLQRFVKIRNLTLQKIATSVLVEQELERNENE